jgi:hypothetical protein
MKVNVGCVGRVVLSAEDSCCWSVVGGDGVGAGLVDHRFASCWSR